MANMGNVFHGQIYDDTVQIHRSLSSRMKLAVTGNWCIFTLYKEYLTCWSSLTFHLQLLFFLCKDLDWLVLYMPSHQCAFDILYPANTGSSDQSFLSSALYHRTTGTEINSTALQAAGIMRLFHWLEFNWEAATGWGREERPLKSLSTGRLPLALLYFSSQGSFHSFTLFHCVSCSLCPLGNFCRPIPPLSSSLSGIDGI